LSVVEVFALSSPSFWIVNLVFATIGLLKDPKKDKLGDFVN
jgi:hypothetical protein